MTMLLLPFLAVSPRIPSRRFSASTSKLIWLSSPAPRIALQSEGNSFSSRASSNPKVRKPRHVRSRETAQCQHIAYGPRLELHAEEIELGRSTRGGSLVVIHSGDKARNPGPGLRRQRRLHGVGGSSEIQHSQCKGSVGLRCGLDEGDRVIIPMNGDGRFETGRGIGDVSEPVIENNSRRKECAMADASDRKEEKRGHRSERKEEISNRARKKSHERERSKR